MEIVRILLCVFFLMKESAVRPLVTEYSDWFKVPRQTNDHIQKRVCVRVV